MQELAGIKDIHPILEGTVMDVALKAVDSQVKKTFL